MISRINVNLSKIKHTIAAMPKLPTLVSFIILKRSSLVDPPNNPSIVSMKPSMWRPLVTHIKEIMINTDVTVWGKNFDEIM